MKCSNHVNNDAVSSCKDCGRGLCAECTNKFEFPICDRCNLNRSKGDTNSIFKSLSLSFVFAFIGITIWVALSSDFPKVYAFSYILVGYISASVPWGWATLTKITPNIFLFLPLIGWVIYFALKGYFALIVGPFVFPFKLYSMYKNLKKSKEIKKSQHVN